MKNTKISEMVRLVTYVLIFFFVIFLVYLSLKENSSFYANITLNMVTVLQIFAFVVLIPLVYMKANKLSGGRLSIAYFIQEITKKGIDAGGYNEEDALNYVYRGLTDDIKSKYTKPRIKKVLEYLSYFNNEKQIPKKELLISFSKVIKEITAEELDKIVELENNYTKSIITNITH